jgi:thiamine biosynthesis protein ThiS
VTQSTISLVVNGKPHQLPAPSRLPSLLESLGIDRRMIAVAHNGEVIPRDTYDHLELNEGDRIEIVRMVGGG